MLTKTFRFIFTLPETIREILCMRHQYDAIGDIGSDWHSVKQCRKCGKTTTEFL